MKRKKVGKSFAFVTIRGNTCSCKKGQITETRKSSPYLGYGGALVAELNGAQQTPDDPEGRTEPSIRANVSGGGEETVLEEPRQNSFPQHPRTIRSMKN